jgi:lysylphosphatidylglycerol synthetase-like protein (DUF2156 family)
MLAFLLCLGFGILNLIDAYQTAKYAGKTWQFKDGTVYDIIELNPVGRLLLRNLKVFWAVKICVSLLFIMLSLLWDLDPFLPILLILGCLMTLLAFVVLSGFYRSTRHVLKSLQTQAGLLRQKPGYQLKVVYCSIQVHQGNRKSQKLYEENQNS